MPGILYLVATPIGNLEDITLRALRILKECDLVAAEDTRVTRKLLSHFQISKPLVSYYGAREKSKAGALKAQLQQGKTIALATDAGTPGISDPGLELVRAAWETGSAVIPVPGPSAVVAALSACGLPPQPFYFQGFLPPKAGERREALKALAGLQATLVFYEAPHRLAETLADMEAVFGARRAAVCRELTKLHEEIVPAGLDSLAARFAGEKARGEITLVVEGSPEAPQPGIVPGETAAEELARLASEGLALNEAIALVARRRGLPRKEVYKLGHGL